jgi:hypothetical protein
MINEKELRTGNLYSTIRNQEVLIVGIDTINKFVTIASSNNTEINTKNESSIIFEDLNPIEITPKSIVQLGLSTDESSSLSIVSDNDVKFSWNEELNQVVLLDGTNGIIGQDIKYFHQLQNIYYFLTGKELAIYQ